MCAVRPLARRGAGLLWLGVLALRHLNRGSAVVQPLEDVCDLVQDILNDLRLLDVEREPQANDRTTPAVGVVDDPRRPLVLEVTQGVLRLGRDLQPERDQSVIVPPPQVDGERKLEASAADEATVHAQSVEQMHLGAPEQPVCKSPLVELVHQAHQLQDAQRSRRGKVQRCERKEGLLVFQTAQAQELVEIAPDLDLAPAIKLGADTGQEGRPARDTQSPRLVHGADDRLGGPDLSVRPQAFPLTAVQKLSPQQVLPLRRGDEEQTAVSSEPVEVAAGLVVGERRPELALHDEVRVAADAAHDVRSPGGGFVPLLVTVLEGVRGRHAAGRGQSPQVLASSGRSAQQVAEAGGGDDLPLWEELQRHFGEDRAVLNVHVGLPWLPLRILSTVGDGNGSPVGRRSNDYAGSSSSAPDVQTYGASRRDGIDSCLLPGARYRLGVAVRRASTASGGCLMSEKALQKMARLRDLRNRSAHGMGPAPEELAIQMRELGFDVSANDAQWALADLARGVATDFLPPQVLAAFLSAVEGRSIKTLCDPFAGSGVLAACITEEVHVERALACLRNERVLGFARSLAPQIEWHVDDSLAFLGAVDAPLDMVVSVLPFGARTARKVNVEGPSGETLVVSRDLADALVVTAASRLSPDGLGLFVVAPSFFAPSKSIVAEMPRLGLGVEAALEMPAGSFAPQTTIASYLIVMRCHPVEEMFVGQISSDRQTNRQLFENLRHKTIGGAIELGRLVNPVAFKGLNGLKITERFRQAEERSGTPALPLRELAHAVKLGRPDERFRFPEKANSLLLPVIGVSDVVTSVDDATLKLQNYAQVSIDPGRSDARFVARFLNSDLGRASREMCMSGTTIKKLNTSGIQDVMVLVPDLRSQTQILETETRIETERNTLLVLENDLASMRRELWANPSQLLEIDERVRAFSGQLASHAAPLAASTLEQWFETLPFPLASILRAWQATPPDEFKSRYEHLAHFFEAAAEFVSVLLLSAFSSNPELLKEHRPRLQAAWRMQNLSLERATFGTWKVALEYLAKQTRQMLSDSAESRALCAGLFEDQTLALPEMLADVRLSAAISKGNKMRNDWVGHGGIVGDAEARLRNERLLSEVQSLRDAMADGWSRVQLVQCVSCRPRGGVFENLVALLTGSNGEFLKDSRAMATWLDVERLYVIPEGSERALLLLPLLLIGPSPESARNACYFFNRVEKDGLRFVSYHFVDQPERTDRSPDTSQALGLLTELGPTDQ